MRVPIDESHPKDPINPYGATKLAFERTLLDHARGRPVKAIALRYFNAAGCHPDGSLGEEHDPEEHLVPLRDRRRARTPPAPDILGDDYATPDGTCVRDYIHVQDLARAHVLALEAVSARTRSRSTRSTWAAAPGTRSSRWSRPSAACGHARAATIGPRRPGDPPQLVASPAKALEKLGFATKAGLEEIVETAFRWRSTRAV